MSLSNLSKRAIKTGELKVKTQVIVVEDKQKGPESLRLDLGLTLWVCDASKLETRKKVAVLYPKEGSEMCVVIGEVMAACWVGTATYVNGAQSHS